MAIQPVISSSFGIKTNNLNFEGKKDKKNVAKNELTNPVTPSKLSVPLALVMAMSPANLKSANDFNVKDSNNFKIEVVDENSAYKDVIKSQRFFDSRIPKLVTVDGDLKWVKFSLYNNINLINKDLQRGDFEDIEIETTIGNISDLKVVSKMTELVTYNYSILSDDGTRTPFATVRRIFMQSEETNNINNIETAAACEFVAKELKSSRNNSNIKQTVRNIDLRPDAKSRTLQNVPNGNILKNAKPIDRSAYKYLGDQIIEGDNGKYTFKYYNYTGNKSIEEITIQKPGMPEVRVAGVYQGKARFGAHTEKEPVHYYYLILLEDGDGKRYCISDPSLAVTLAQALDEPQVFGGAFDRQALEQDYLYTPKGAVTPVN